MSRIDYFRDSNAPEANSVVPSVTAIVQDDAGRLLLTLVADPRLLPEPDELAGLLAVELGGRVL